MLSAPGAGGTAAFTPVINISNIVADTSRKQSEGRCSFMDSFPYECRLISADMLTIGQLPAIVKES
jgi:hypothetical protein